MVLIMYPGKLHQLRHFLPTKHSTEERFSFSVSIKSPNQIQPRRAERKKGHFTSQVLMRSATCVYLQRGRREASKPDLWELHAAVSASLSRVTERHHTVLSDRRSHCSETWTSRCCTLTLLRLLAERLDGKSNLLNAAFVSGNVEELQLDSYKGWTGLKMVNMLMEIFTQLYIRSISTHQLLSKCKYWYSPHSHFYI